MQAILKSFIFHVFVLFCFVFGISVCWSEPPFFRTTYCIIKNHWSALPLDPVDGRNPAIAGIYIKPIKPILGYLLHQLASWISEASTVLVVSSQTYLPPIDALFAKVVLFIYREWCFWKCFPIRSVDNVDSFPLSLPWPLVDGQIGIWKHVECEEHPFSRCPFFRCCVGNAL